MVRRVFPLGGLSGTADRLKMCIFIPDNPPTPLQVLAAFLIYLVLGRKGAPEPRNAPSQFIPFDPFLSGAFIGSAAARVFISGVRCRSRYLWGVPTQSGRY